MGNAYMQQQDFDKALENHTKDYDIAVAKVCVWGGGVHVVGCKNTSFFADDLILLQGYKDSKSRALSNMGRVLVEMGDHKEVRRGSSLLNTQCTSSNSSHIPAGHCQVHRGRAT